MPLKTNGSFLLGLSFFGGLSVLFGAFLGVLVFEIAFGCRSHRVSGVSRSGWPPRCNCSERLTFICEGDEREFCLILRCHGSGCGGQGGMPK